MGLAAGKRQGAMRPGGDNSGQGKGLVPDVPAAGNGSTGRFYAALCPAQPAARNRGNAEFPVAPFQSLNAQNAPVQEVSHRAGGIMVEGKHTVPLRLALFIQRIPAFPDGGGSVLDFIQPGGAVLLQQQLVGQIPVSMVSQRKQQIGRPREACFPDCATSLARLSAMAWVSVPFVMLK